MQQLEVKARRFYAQNRREIGYGLGGLATGALTTLQSLFGVAYFIDVVHLSPRYFVIVHTAYGIWNAVNDPVFGFMLDNSDKPGVLTRRLPVLKYGGPLWCLTFMLTFYGWSFDGEALLAAAHFFFTLFLYDGFLTYVLIVKCALLADLCVESKERTRLNKFSAWLSMCGSGVAALAYYLWDPSNLEPFRRMAWCVCAMAALAWWLSASVLSTSITHVNSRTEPPRKPIASPPDHAGSDPSGNGSSLSAILKFVREISAVRNFWLYTFMNFIMNFEVGLSASFFIYFDKLLLQQAMPPWWRSVVVMFSLYLPFLGVQLLTPICDKYSLYSMIHMCTLLKIGVAACMLMGGKTAYILWGMGLVVQKFLLQSWGFYDLIMADVIDEDKAKYKRTVSVSTSIHGLQAFIVKPAQSLAPIFGLLVLQHIGLTSDSDSDSDSDNATFEPSTVIFNLLCLVPLLGGFAQFLLWRKFDLRGAKLMGIKDELKKTKNPV
eukprot:g2200.t1